MGGLDSGRPSVPHRKRSNSSLFALTASMSDDESRSPASDEPLGDIPCAGCGYSLRGLTVTGACPECNHSCLRSWVRATASKPPALPRWLGVVRGVHAGNCALVAVLLAVEVRAPALVRWLPESAAWTMLGIGILGAGPVSVLCARHGRWRLPLALAAALIAGVMILMVTAH